MANNHIVDVSELLGIIALAHRIDADLKKDIKVFNGEIAYLSQVNHLHYHIPLKDSKWIQTVNGNNKKSPVKHYTLDFAASHGSHFKHIPSVKVSITGLKHPSSYHVGVTHITKTQCIVSVAQTNHGSWESDVANKGTVQVEVAGIAV